MRNAKRPDKPPSDSPEESPSDRHIAYFSMEIGIDQFMPTYSGGLGVLAGDMMKSCSDLKVPVVAMSLLYKKGYFYQKLDQDGNQQELPCEWNPDDFLEPLSPTVCVRIGDKDVCVRAWKYDIEGVGGFRVPVIFLDTDFEDNSESCRALTHHLYGGDLKHRLAQEMLLGIGGVRMIRALGYTGIHRYHMNEGHSALLTLELMNEHREKHSRFDAEAVKRMCIFTTHTPVPAGHDKFPYSLVDELLGDFIPKEQLRQFGGEDNFNMTLLALNLSHFENGVAKEHRRVSQEMFPGYHIDSITNGVHSATWVCDSLQKLFDKYIPGWKNDSFSLRYALNIPREEIWNAHVEAKERLINTINELTNAGLDHHAFTIGFARRATAYKRADLIFHDTARLVEIAKRVGKIQIVFGGKAHAHDEQGKELIKKIVSLSHQLKKDIKIVYVHNYDMALARHIVSGVDLWLNTPRKPLEASGTSGMKAAHNGVPSLSILDGWWIEGCIEDFTGWAIGTYDDKCDDAENAASLYEKLEKIIPTFYNRQHHWIGRMRHTIAVNASFFNTHRMVLQYVMSAYM